jgi:hypothetical protein
MLPNIIAMLIEAIPNFPIKLRLMGIVTIFVFGFFSFVTWRELQAFPQKPTHMLLSEAVLLTSTQRPWVVIDDIKWDCSHIYYSQVDRRTHTDIVFTNGDNSLWGYAMFSDELTCDEVLNRNGIGVLSIANNKKRSDFINSGFDISSHEANGKFLALCTYCGRSNSLIRVILSVFMVVIGALLVVGANRMQKRMAQL